jgi:hypothetical protein
MKYFDVFAMPVPEFYHREKYWKLARYCSPSQIVTYPRCCRQRRAELFYRRRHYQDFDTGQGGQAYMSKTPRISTCAIVRAQRARHVAQMNRQSSQEPLLIDARSCHSAPSARCSYILEFVTVVRLHPRHHKRVWR